MSTVRPIPEGFHTVSPHIVVRDADSAIDFYKRAFGAQELMRMPGPDGVRNMTIVPGDGKKLLSGSSA